MPCKSLNIEYWKEYSFNYQQKKPDKSRDIGMTIVCDDDGKFQIIHWPPLPVEDSVAILQILEVKSKKFASLIERMTRLFRNQRLRWRKFSIERFKLDVNVDLKFVFFLRILKFKIIVFSRN